MYELKVLVRSCKIGPFEELDLKSETIGHQAFNWGTALAMLYREVKAVKS